LQFFHKIPTESGKFPRQKILWVLEILIFFSNFAKMGVFGPVFCVLKKTFLTRWFSDKVPTA